jgi:hypothetical protein
MSENVQRDGSRNCKKKTLISRGETKMKKQFLETVSHTIRKPVPSSTRTNKPHYICFLSSRDIIRVRACSVMPSGRHSTTWCFRYGVQRTPLHVEWLSNFEVVCKLFGIILIVHNTSGIIQTVCSCHFLIIILLFLIINIIIIINLVFLSVKFLCSDLLNFSTNYPALFIAWQVKYFAFSSPLTWHLNVKCPSFFFF